MKPTKQLGAHHLGSHSEHRNADLLREAGGDFEMAFYKAKEQVNVLSATVN